MFELAAPWALLLLPLPLVVWWLAPPKRESVQAIRVPFFHGLANVVGETPRAGAVVLNRRFIQMAVAIIIWLLIVAALANPQWVGEPIVQTDAARDVMLAIDISGSMDENDFVAPDGSRVRRMDAVKQVVGEFIDRREGDRIGLIVFGSKAYVQIPFTQDLRTARALLDEIEVGMAGPNTALGDAIGLAIRTFEVSKVEQRLLILLTDGSDTGSMMTPINAAEIARNNGVETYTIGAGDPQGNSDERVDFATLQEVAKRAGGQFFNAADVVGLETVYARIEELVPKEVKTVSFRPRQSLFHWPAGMAVGFGIAGYFFLLVLARRSGGDD